MPSGLNGHETDTQFGQGRQHLGLRVAGPQRVLALHRGDRVHRVGSADRAGGGLGQPEVPDLSRPRPAHRPHRRRLRSARPGRPGADRTSPGCPPPGVAGTRRRPGLICSGRLLSPTDLPSSICQPNLVAMTTWSRTRRQGLTDQFLVDVRAVHLGGVEERDTQLDGAAEHADHVLPAARVRAVALRHAHAAHADRRDLKPLTQCASVHLPGPFNSIRRVRCRCPCQRRQAAGGSLGCSPHRRPFHQAVRMGARRTPAPRMIRRRQCSRSLLTVVRPCILAETVMHTREHSHPHADGLSTKM